jgi:uncharacterized membrane protein YagU involved in acid resistance
MGFFKGVIAGTIGVAGMAGAITTLRRALLPPDHPVKTHPEGVVERVHALLGRSDGVDVMTRRRSGDLIHFAYGAMWGGIYANLTEGRRPHPFVGGPVLGAALWTLGFCLLLPLSGVHPGPWRWQKREFLLTGVAHLSYGTVMALILDALDASRDSAIDE